MMIMRGEKNLFSEFYVPIIIEYTISCMDSYTM